MNDPDEVCWDVKDAWWRGLMWGVGYGVAGSIALATATLTIMEMLK